MGDLDPLLGITRCAISNIPKFRIWKARVRIKIYSGGKCRTAEP
jgi:hypothetical protein